MKRKMTIRELSAILTALYTYQDTRDRGPLPRDLADIETNGGTLVPLSDDEINQLREDLNCSETVIQHDYY